MSSFRGTHRQDGWQYDHLAEQCGRRDSSGGSYLFVNRAADLRDLIERLQDAPCIAFDTEFISEGRYYPQLCLIQIAAGNTLALIDPLSLSNLEPFWNLLCDGQRDVIVHACRSELEFCFRAIGRMPERLFDVQLAVGFLGFDYPMGFRTLLDRLLQVNVSKAETRTNWHKRPLEPRQIEYALGDVRYLEQMTGMLKDQLMQKGRLTWYEQEISDLMARLRTDFQTPRWRNMPKISSLTRRELAILQEVWHWRNDRAKKWNIPVGRVLRDDLLVELARRGTSDPKRIASVRGFQRSDLPKILPEITEAVQRGLDTAPADLPERDNRTGIPDYAAMTQLLFAALRTFSKQEQVATILLGGPSDIRELIADRLGTLPSDTKPKLTHGWRKELIGERLEDVLLGRTMLRIDCNHPEDPLVFLNTTS